VLVDSSVWVDHLRRGNAALASSLQAAEVWCHPFVIGEIAYGHLRRRREILSLLRALPRAPLAGHDEALAFVEAHDLASSGIGWIDVHLLASTRLANIPFWTRDKRLASVARDLGIAAQP
jgi:predicted nucleic acid-binding protein